MLAKIIFSCCLAAYVMADQPTQSYNYQPPEQPSYQAPSNRQNTYRQPESEEGMPFKYSYEVKDEYSGLDFGHNTDSDGKVTTGEYRVLLPDGRTQIVTYRVDGYSGFEAEVNYEGEARPYEPQPSASYQQPRQSYSQPREQPRQTYEQPREQPRQTYEQPREQPRQTYEQPREQPRQTYEQPREQPRQTYEQPREQPRQSYSQPERNSYGS